MSSEIAKIAREVAKEYAEQTHDKIGTYYRQTSLAIKDMSVSVSDMAKSVQRSNEQLARYEERQSATAERMERIETVLREQGVHQREVEKELEQKIADIRDDVRDNNNIRRIIIWLATVIVASIIGSGLIFSSLTGKEQPKSKPETPPKTQAVQTKALE